MATIGSIVLNISANTSDLISGLDKARSAVKDFTKQYEGEIGAFKSVSAIAAGAVAATAAGIAALTASGLKSVDMMNDLSQRLGTNINSLTQLGYAAQLNGSNQEELSAALAKMNITLGKAAIAGGPAADALKRMGLDAKTLASQDPAETFKQIADGIKGIKSPAEQAATTVTLFGKSGLNVLQTLQQGSAGIDKFAAELTTLRGTISQLDAEKVGAANDYLDRMRTIVEGISAQLAVQMAPHIVAVGKLFVQWFTSAGGAAGTTRTAMDGLFDASMLLASSVKGLALVWKAFFLGGAGLVYGLAKPVVLLVEGLEKVVKLLTGKESGAGQFAANFDAALSQMIADQGAAFSDLYNSDPIAAYKAALEQAKIELQATADAAQEAKTGTNALSEAQKEADVHVQDLITKMEQQIEAVGRGSNAQEIMKLATEGASDAMIEQAKALDGQLTKAQANQKAMDALAKVNAEIAGFGNPGGAEIAALIASGADAETVQQLRQQNVVLEQKKKLKEMDGKLAESAKKWIEDTLMPLEKYHKALDEIQAAREKGLLTQEESTKAQIKAKNDLDKAGGDKPENAALEFGSAAARTAIIQTQRGKSNDPINSVAKSNEQLLADQTNQTIYIRRIYNDAVNPKIVRFG